MEHYIIEGWSQTKDRLPEEGELVDTCIYDEKGRRNFSELVRKGSLWFFPDMTAYVYYTPTHWKKKTRFFYE